MRRNIIITGISIIIAFAAFASCVKEDCNCHHRDLLLTPSIYDMSAVKSSSGYIFKFDNGDVIDLNIVKDGIAVKKTYKYADGVFVGDGARNVYRFDLDDSPITSITANWPNKAEESEFKTDQRLEADYKGCDYLTATISNIMPTDAPVPMSFTHKNCKLIFEVEGQNDAGRAIEALIMDIRNTGYDNGKATAYRAYIDEETGNAELILLPGTLSIPSYPTLTGRVTLKSGVTGSIGFPGGVTMIMEPGTAYLITLTPRGDDLVFTGYIGGFGQYEYGIAIPFAKKEIDGVYYYVIDNTAKLFAARDLVYQYNANSDVVWYEENWSAVNFIQETNFDFLSTGTDPVCWEPIPEGKYSGTYKVADGYVFKQDGVDTQFADKD